MERPTAALPLLVFPPGWSPPTARHDRTCVSACLVGPAVAAFSKHSLSSGTSNRAGLGESFAPRCQARWCSNLHLRSARSYSHFVPALLLIFILLCSSSFPFPPPPPSSSGSSSSPPRHAGLIYSCGFSNSSMSANTKDFNYSSSEAVRLYFDL